MTTAAQWIAGARPRTLPAAIAPVAVGTGLAVNAGSFRFIEALLALIVALALQVGVNYANDYSDGIRGTDNARIGPVRLVGQGLASPTSVKRAAYLAFLVAAFSGLGLVLLTGQWWLVLVGAAAIGAAWLYTGGPRPYGYLGLGELFVLVFFGIVPVVGTMYVQTLTITTSSVIAGISVGLLACGVLLTNNIRDIPTDTQSGKRTLAVRLGDRPARALYAVTIITAFALVIPVAISTGPWTYLAFAAVPLSITPVRIVLGGTTGPGLIPALKATGNLVLVFGLALALGVAFNQ